MFRQLLGDSNIQCGLGAPIYSPDLEFREPQSVHVHGGEWWLTDSFLLSASQILLSVVVDEAAFQKASTPN